MSLTAYTLACDWPGCEKAVKVKMDGSATAFTEVDRGGILGKHLCGEHARRTRVEYEAALREQRLQKEQA